MVQIKCKTKMCRNTNTIKLKLKKVNFGNFIMKYDFLHDALIVICNQNLECPRYLRDIGLSELELS